MSLDVTGVPATPSALDRRTQRLTQGREDQRNRRLAVVRLRIRQLGEARFGSKRLGYPEPQALRTLHEHLGRAIAVEEANGVARHRPLSWAVRQVPKVVALIDGVVLYTFCAVILNVAPDDPLGQPLSALAAAFLAVLAAGASYVWLAQTGDRLRTFRDDLGEIRWRLLGGTSWFMIGVSVVLIAALSTLMYQRVLTESLDALDPTQAGSAVAMAVAFALVSAVGNLAVIAVHALDGSLEADLHRESGALLLMRQRELHEQQLHAVRLLPPCEASPEDPEQLPA